MTEGSPEGRKSRHVPIPRYLVQPLRDLAKDRDADEYLFTAPRGGRVYVHTWRSRSRSRSWARTIAGSGLEVQVLASHSLRHTFASWAIAAGCDVKMLQSILGHARATETLNTYGHLFPERLDEVADAVSALHER